MILDTNALSAWADGDTPLRDMVIDAPSRVLPVIVLGEFRFGIMNSRRFAEYEQWLKIVLTGCEVMTVDQDTAVEYAKVREELRLKGQPIPSNDVWIAALARQHGGPILSRDQHFDVVAGLKRLSW